MCDCKEWQENIGFINQAFTLNLSVVGDYVGKVFQFCPWCAKALPQEQKPIIPINHKIGSALPTYDSQTICDDQTVPMYVKWRDNGF